MNFRAILFGCTDPDCHETWTEPPTLEAAEPDHAFHTTYVDQCFACKISTLQLNTGDAGRAESPPQKKWDRELAAYKDARAQGMQPAGTTHKHIDEAKRASDILGKAYNSETMMPAAKIDNRRANLMREIG